MEFSNVVYFRCCHCRSTGVEFTSPISTCPQRGRGQAAVRLGRGRQPIDFEAIGAPFVESERFHLRTAHL